MSALIYRRSEGALWRRVGADVVATTPRDAEVHHLTGGASAVWWALELPGSVPDVAEAVADVVVGDVDAIRSEVESCMHQLGRMDLLEVDA